MQLIPKATSNKSRRRIDQFAQILVDKVSDFQVFRRTNLSLIPEDISYATPASNLEHLCYPVSVQSQG